MVQGPGYTKDLSIIGVITKTEKSKLLLKGRYLINRGRYSFKFLFSVGSHLVAGKCDRQKLRLKDVYKRDLERLNVSTDKWEMLANDRDKWGVSTLHSIYNEKKQNFEKPKQTSQT